MIQNRIYQIIQISQHYDYEDMLKILVNCENLTNLVKSNKDVSLSRNSENSQIFNTVRVSRLHFQNYILKICKNHTISAHLVEIEQTKKT